MFDLERDLSAGSARQQRKKLLIFVNTKQSEKSSSGIKHVDSNGIVYGQHI